MAGRQVAHPVIPLEKHCLISRREITNYFSSSQVPLALHTFIHCSTLWYEYITLIPVLPMKSLSASLWCEFFITGMKKKKAFKKIFFTSKCSFKDITHFKNTVIVKILNTCSEIFAIESSNFLSLNIRSRVNNYSLFRQYFIVV